MRENGITERVIAAAIEVHRELGPGLLESAYEACMVVELLERALSFEREYPVPLVYKGAAVDCGYRIDFLVERRVVVELKSVDQIHPIHEAQVLSYLKATGCPVGLLLNFNARYMRQGIRRFILTKRSPSAPSAPLR